MSHKTRSKFHILVVGGGIAGFACAVGLRRKGHKVTVVERSAGLQTWTGGLLISSNALRGIEDFGLMKNFSDVPGRWATHTIYRHDGQVLDILSNKANENVFGYEMLGVRRQKYQQILYEGAVREGVKVRFGCRVESIDEAGPSVKLSSGEMIEADLIVGADGIKSVVRGAILGPQNVHLKPDSTAYQCTISLSLMNSNPLTAPLVAEYNLQSWWGPNTHFICGKVDYGGETYSASFFIHPPKDQPLPAFENDEASAANSQNWDLRGNIHDILANMSPYESRVKEFVKMIKPEDCALWKVAAVPDLPTWVSDSGRIVLLGDAAHAMTPHLGQGSAMCIEDCGVLAECIARVQTVDDIPKAVRVYEMIRKPRAEKIKKEADLSGDYKTLMEGSRRRRRDEAFAERLKPGPKYEFWRASGHLKWVYGWNYKEEAKRELDKVFPVGKSAVDRARI